MRFFDINIAHISFPGTYDAICEAANVDSCFDGLGYTYWSSVGYSTDAVDDIWIERDFGSPRTINRIFIQDTNVLDMDIQYWTGSAFVGISKTTYKSVDNRSIFFEFDDLETSKIRLIGAYTITPNEEKTIGSVFAFTEIGQMVIPPADIKAKLVKEQDGHKLITGKKFIFNRGRRWEIALLFKAHIGQEDIDLLKTLVDRDNDFHVWINDDSEDVMRQIVEPFAFKNLLKVSVEKGETPSYYKNIWVSGMANKILMTEVE